MEWCILSRSTLQTPKGTRWLCSENNLTTKPALNNRMSIVCGTVVKSRHPDSAESVMVGGLGVWNSGTHFILLFNRFIIIS